MPCWSTSAPGGFFTPQSMMGRYRGSVWRCICSLTTATMYSVHRELRVFCCESILAETSFGNRLMCCVVRYSLTLNGPEIPKSSIFLQNCPKKASYEGLLSVFLYHVFATPLLEFMEVESCTLNIGASLFPFLPIGDKSMQKNEKGLVKSYPISSQTELFN